MSIHQSLKLKNKLQRTRNVLTRAERLEIMRRDGNWSQGESEDPESRDSVFGLPKLRVPKG